MGLLSEKWALAVLSAGWLLLCAGCAGSAGTSAPSAPPEARPPAGSPLRPQEPAADKRAIVAPELSNTIRVVRVRMNHINDAYLRIQVLVQNLTDKPQKFLYHIDWFNEQGDKLPSATQDYIPWMLMPREVSPIATTAPTPSAVDFGIAIVPAGQ